MWFSKGFTVLSSNLTTRATRFPKFCQSEDLGNFYFFSKLLSVSALSSKSINFVPKNLQNVFTQKNIYKQNISITINTVYRFGFVSDFILL